MDASVAWTADHVIELKKPEIKKPEPPIFNRRWWYKPNRLDARPVIWSLYNRPKEWRMESPYRLLHVPSKHEFWVGSGRFMVSLFDADCSCLSRSDRGKFQRFQKGSFWRAYKHWRKNHDAVDADHFAAHFLGSK